MPVVIKALDPAPLFLLEVFVYLKGPHMPVYNPKLIEDPYE
jgi:hypothetical protein